MGHHSGVVVGEIIWALKGENQIARVSDPHIQPTIDVTLHLKMSKNSPEWKFCFTAKSVVVLESGYADSSCWRLYIHTKESWRFAIILTYAENLQ